MATFRFSPGHIEAAKAATKEMAEIVALWLVVVGGFWLYDRLKETLSIEGEFGRYLRTGEGRFAEWLAEQSRETISEGELSEWESPEGRSGEAGGGS